MTCGYGIGWRRSVGQSTYQMISVKTGRSRKIPVNDNKNETMELNGTYNERQRGDSLQREIVEGRMEGKGGRGRPRQKLLDWMMTKDTANLRKKLHSRNMEPLEVWTLDLPEGKELKEKEQEQSKDKEHYSSQLKIQ